jgi:hypothetical protein
VLRVTAILAPERTEVAEVDLVDDSEFFAPVASDVIDSLIGRYQDMRARIEQVGEVINSERFAGAVQYFLDGNSDPGRRYSSYTVEKMFGLGGAVAQLNSAFWSQALSLTDVYDCMPQARRDEWNKQLRHPQGVKKYERFADSGKAQEWELQPLPDFTETTVRDTLSGLLAARAKFFAERVDGIFRGLSGEHVTNSPAGFGKRMIIGYMLSYGSIRHERAGLINDLRCVIAKFMGRDEPKYNTASVLISELYRCTGQWVSIDGGTLRIRVYKKGTAHLEVHPDMAWRLNQVLANLYPLAIPAEHRARPKKRAKDFLMMGRPLPFATLNLLADGLNGYDARHRPAKAFSFDYKAKEHPAAYKDACAVLAALGGTPNKDGSYEFDYPVEPVLREVIISGCLPDQVAHQFYPTPEKLARICAELAEICEYDTVLEPSAGQGDLAAFLPKDRTTCVEISPLHCAVLKAKGFDAVQADFIAWSEAAPQFSAVVMNPPFANGRAHLHVERAGHKVKPGGRLVAILPASAKGKDWLGKGWACEWSSVYEREFAGTGVAVVILKASRKQEASF